MDVIADADLADACKPGDRVQIIGLFRVLPNKQNASSSGNFRSIIIANNVLLMSKEANLRYSAQDLKNIRELPKKTARCRGRARALVGAVNFRP